jgi:AraC-like DNA-binding protein
LGPAEIAAAVSISTRYLHKLLEADRQTVSLYIKGLRLDRARQDLLDPRQAGRPISAIAYSCGFGDLSGFNRAFKQAYAAPKELRNASASTAYRPASAAKFSQSWAFSSSILPMCSRSWV